MTAATKRYGKKPGRKAGTAVKVSRFNMRCDDEFHNYLAYISKNPSSSYHGMKPSAIIEALVTDAVTILELSHGHRYDRNTKY